MTSIHTPFICTVHPPDLYAEIMSSILRLERKQKNFQILFEFTFSFFLAHLELKR